ncbi:MAG: hypothetical protein ACRCZ2_12950 [Fusobacteriaceae bacterium]
MRQERARLRRLERRFKDKLEYVKRSGADDHIIAEVRHLSVSIGEATEAYRLATFMDALENRVEESPF